MVGDLIRWTRSDKKRGLLSPELARVEKIEKQRIELRHVTMTPDGLSSRQCDGAESSGRQKISTGIMPCHHQLQFTIQTVSSAILHLESFRKNLASQPPGLSRFHERNRM